MDKPNLDYIKELSGDDTEFEQQFINILKTEFPEEVKTYKKAITEVNFYDAAQIVHKIKHKFNILSMTNAYALAVVFEEELNAENVHRDSEFLEVLKIVETYLKSI